MSLDRRQFLARTGLGAAGLTTALDAVTARAAATPLQQDGAEQRNPYAGRSSRLPAVAFHGVHQAGIVTLPQPASCFAAFDVVEPGRHALAELLRTLTASARFLTAGRAPRNLGTGAPPADSGTLGAVVPADGLTITVGVGSSLFDERFGLRAHRPRHLTPMRSFPNDDLNPAQCGGDLLLQICAGSADTAIHALREIAKHTRGTMQIRWRIDGFISPPRPSGVPRNHLGFNDGIANPNVADAAVARRLLWVTDRSGEPGWAVGGTYHVCRIITVAARGSFLLRRAMANSFRRSRRSQVRPTRSRYARASSPGTSRRTRGRCIPAGASTGPA